MFTDETWNDRHDCPFEPLSAIPVFRFVRSARARTAFSLSHQFVVQNLSELVSVIIDDSVDSLASKEIRPSRPDPIPNIYRRIWNSRRDVIDMSFGTTSTL